MGNGENTYEYCPHRVAIPPAKPFFKALKTSLKETFFPDDPFRQFKNQPATRRLVLGLQYFVPFLEWAPRYTLSFFKSDLIAGITIASLAVPQGISYANLANLPPILGLYSSFVPPLVYAMLGSSRDLAVGTVAVGSLLIGTMLGKEISPTENPKLYLQLAMTATFFAGVFQALLGFLRLGFVVDFLSHATIVGFMSGAATVVCLQQLKGIGHLKKGLNPVSVGPFSRSAVNFNAGCKTAVSNIVMAMAVMITLLFLTPLFHYTPLVVLSTIIIVAMISLIDYESAIHLWKVDKVDFLVCIGAYLGVVFASVEIGLIVAVTISLLRLLLFVARPRTVVLGNIPNSMIYRSTDQYPTANNVPGVLIIQIDAPIYFANSNYLRERISRWIYEEEDKLKSAGETSLHYVILDLSSVGSIDTSGISMLEETKKNVDRKGLKLVLANPRSEVIKKLDKSKFINAVGQEWIYLTVGEAVAACNFMMHTCKPNVAEAQESNRQDENV
ncbi:hypothetical protein TIFTF001_015941 [Ficus carica]|uniref:STAS domain-containing protein n=1 Tax=Ficus carica TaxID=3494 RepID=A0AA88AST3_FICCA|nr:hypothetical protein TIFTF001_015941 [Ficus carica]